MRLIIFSISLVLVSTLKAGPFDHDGEPEADLRNGKTEGQTVNYLGHVEVDGRVIPGSGTAAPPAPQNQRCPCKDYACWRREINHNGQHAVGGCGVSALTTALGVAFKATRIAECVAAGADTVNILMNNRETLGRALNYCHSQRFQIDTAAGLAKCQSHIVTSGISDASTAASIVRCLTGGHVEVAKQVPLPVVGSARNFLSGLMKQCSNG